MGCLLRGVKRDQLRRGQCIVAPGTVKSVKKFKAQIYVRLIVSSSSPVLTHTQVLTKDEGGRYTPFMAHYRPQLYIRTVDVTVELVWPEGTEGASDKLVMPGDNVEMVGNLVHDVALEAGTRFTLREGGKTIGTGIVSEIY